jgi:hypothetical protein
MSELFDGVNSFEGGMNSYLDPTRLPVNQYVSGNNIVCRGGIAQTRPGYKTIFGLPCGYLQGLTLFTPTGDRAHLVFAVNGFVYVSRAPFLNYYKLPNIQFAANSRFIAWATTIQTTDYTADGDLITLDQPRAVLVMQDARTRAAYWDGGDSGHINPTRSTVTNSDGDIVTQPDRDGTPVGLWMAWSGNRLWVSRDNLVFASDFGNPLKFTEGQYLAEGRSFYMPEPVTGMVEPASGSPLLVFGEGSITSLRSDILNRTEWLTTSDFQRTEFVYGCAAARSIVKNYGQVWWYARDGVINLNAAAQTFIDSFTRYVDEPMLYSKGNMSPDRSGICGVARENYLLMSVPSGDRLNRHTWSMDQSAGPNQIVWDGYWTGTRPVEWVTGVVDGETRTFYVSVDYDGVNRLWEAFTPDRTDNGEPITSELVTRSCDFGNALNLKRWLWSQIEADEIGNVTDMSVDYAGQTGGYARIMTKRINSNQAFPQNATEMGSELGFGSPRVQGRVLYTTESGPEPSACGGCPTESNYYDNVSRAFGVRLSWSGRLGVRSIRMVADDDKDQRVDGKCEEDEDETRTVNESGCGTIGNLSLAQAFPRYEATEIEQVTCPDNPDISVISSFTSYSYISEKDAIKKASGAALLEATSAIECKPEPAVFGLLTEAGEPILTEEGEPIIP